MYIKNYYLDNETGENEGRDEKELFDFSLSKKAITIDDIKKNKDLANKIIGWINIEFQKSSQSIQKKKTERLHIDTELKKVFDKSNMYPGYIEQTEKAYISQRNDEGMYPMCEGFDSDDSEIADKLNRMMKYDSIYMHKDVKDIEIVKDVFKYSVGICALSHFDNKTNTPQYKVISPLSRYPDPLANSIDCNYRYHMFSIQTTLGELNERNSRSEQYHCLEEIMPGESYELQQKNIDSVSNTLYGSLAYNDIVYLLQVFLTINQRKYIVTLANAHQLIIRFEEIEGLTKDEKKSPYLVEFPIAIYCPMPSRDGPFGQSYRDKIWKDEIARTRMLDSIYMTSLINAGGSTVLCDLDVISNITELYSKPEVGRHYIGVFGQGKGIQGATSEVIEYKDTTASQNFYQFTTQLSNDKTSITDIRRGLASENNTLGQDTIQMQEANAMFNIDAKMFEVGARMFRSNIYLRGLRENIKSIKEKKIAIIGDFNESIKITSDELDGSNNPYIVIKSKKKIIQENTRKLEQLRAFYAIRANDPTKSEGEKKYYEREMYKKAGFDDEECKKFVPYSADELWARDILKILNGGISLEDIYKFMPEFQIFKDGVDPQVMLFYVQQAIDSSDKDAIIQQLHQMIMEQPNIQQGQGNMSGLANSMSSQMVSQSLQNNQPQNAGQPY